MSDLKDVLVQFQGKSPDEIATMVKRRHIKGRAGTTTRCPMAVLLKGIGTGDFVIGRKYMVRRSGDKIEKARTPRNIAAFVRKFDIGDYPELLMPPPRCTAAASRDRNPPSGKRQGSDAPSVKRGPIVNHLSKLVDRFGTGSGKVVPR